jgi:CheY-like chemotaxis protein
VGAKRILVVDDDPKILETLFNLLWDAGYEVQSTKDSRRAMRMAADLEPHLVILDINMPAPDGFEIAARIRSTPELSKTPILFVTGRNASDDLKKVQELRVEAYVEKPFQKQALLGLVEQILQHPRKGTQRITRGSTRIRKIPPPG